jgi:hypothetical protein
MSSVEWLVGIERNGTVRKLCLVHSIIASGHGGREKKKGRGCLVWDFLLLLANFLLGQRSVTIKREIERERERETGFSFHVHNYSFTFFLFLALPFSMGKSCVTGQSNRRLFGSSFCNCHLPTTPPLIGF